MPMPMPSPTPAPQPQRRRWLLTGIVQGVGFRPHVARVASRFPELSGFCGNDALQVFIEAQAPHPDTLQAFIDAVTSEAPPLSKIMEIRESNVDVVDAESSFRIVASGGGHGARTLLPPDTALCPDCLGELRDPENRRFGYAFTTCTNCGPRLSIILDLPYDRPATTMRDFPMCPVCQSEYRDPENRRYHAQPISCYDCGPHLWTVESSEVPAGANDPFGEVEIPAELCDGSRGGRDRHAQDQVLSQVAAWLRQGRVVAVKGLGGFHLLVNARDEAAVSRLRRRKHRDGKPLALMVRDLAEARELVDLGPVSGPGEAALCGVQHPIVLAPLQDSGGEAGALVGRGVAVSVAPGMDTLGIMLPYTPLHQLLLDRLDFPVVATSGNLSSEPLCYENADALRRLSEIADAFLLHNRDIAVPVEDSVVQLSPGCDSDQGIRISPVRRSRGYAPVPILLPQSYVDVVDATLDLGSHRPDLDPADDLDPAGTNPVILGVGGELKNTFTLSRDGMAFTSAHIGDMESLASQQAFERAVVQMTKIHAQRPGLVVCDRHPNYATTAWAGRFVADLRAKGHPAQLLTLQHHRAHALSLLAEHGAERAVVLAVDGTGFGEDSQIWGSEIFVVDLGKFGRGRGENARRATLDVQWAQWIEQSALRWCGALPAFALVGGDLAVREPWRQGVAVLHRFGLDPRGLPLEQRLCGGAGRLVESQLRAEDESAPAGQAESGSPDDTDAERSAKALRGTDGVAQARPRQSGLAWTRALGRYFDAAAALLGLCEVADHEAAAPVALQTEAVRYLRRCGLGQAFLEPVEDGVPGYGEDGAVGGGQGWLCGEEEVRAVFAHLVEGRREGVSLGELAWRFHQEIAHILASAAIQVARAERIEVIGLTGGSAINWILEELIRREVKEAGLTWLTHREMPANDGGLSLGQAYFGYLLTSRGWLAGSSYSNG